VENPIKGHASFLESIETTTLVIQQYTLVENIYGKKLEEENNLSKENWLRQDPNPLKEAITVLYKSILVYLAQVIRHLAHREACRILSNTFKPDQWDALIGTIKKHRDECDRLLGYLGQELQQSMAKAAREQSNKIENIRKSLDASFKQQLDEIKVTHP
jgi:hypothetical protein